ncbi:putative cyclin-D6-1 [Camellia lanceoleosa]|uniref:Cyclin-D6-1 n=1 Tax=Camellia lanceoleosa TaxID=1840588 RepID=A0ACC0GPE2_9ERIC|nr:putative cyclin-D6-1 [Camellia lanceoleosa]
MEFELENPLTSFREHQPDTVPALFADELDHMPSHYFSQSSKSRDFYISVRREAISLVLQARFFNNFDPSVLYLTISYIDRFISKQEIPKQGKPWIVRLVAISCLSLAAKMKNTDLSLSDLQRDEGFIFESQAICRMELLILTTLNWRMRSITPFSFLYFFLSLFELEDPASTQSLKDRASEIIFKSHYEIKFLEYKPSIIAASALLCASQELLPLQFPCFRAAIASCQYINKEKLLNCLIVMEEMVVMERYESMFDAVSCSTKTPISVLDRHCTTIESVTTTSNNNNTVIAVPERDNIKRRKINNGFCSSDHTVQISQIQKC